MSVKYTLILALSALFSFASGGADHHVQEQMSVNLVELQVRAVNLNQRFISGLSASDFVVKENGEIQSIESIEEIDVGGMPAEEAETNRARIMFLLDYKNTRYASMIRVFRELTQFMDQHYDGRDEIGLAANTLFGVHTLVPFTTDAEVFRKGIAEARAGFRGTNYRRDRPSEMGLNETTSNLGARALGSTQHVEHEWSDAYYRDELEVLNQFVNYLGAWSGRKNLVLISGLWTVPDISDTESNTDAEGIASIKDLQTTSIYNKVAINVIGLYRTHNRSEQTYMNEYYGTTERTSLLAASTGGYYLRGSSTTVSGLMNKTVQHSQKFYLIRYYSNNSGSKFRRVRVAAKGLNRVAMVSGGYYPKQENLGMKAARAKITGKGTAEYVLSMNTDWMAWRKTGFRKRGARYAISQVAYDESDRVLAEQVTVGTLGVKKKGGSYTPALLKKNLSLHIPGKTVPARVETVVTDLNSGKKMTLKHNAGEMI